MRYLIILVLCCSAFGQVVMSGGITVSGRVAVSSSNLQPLVVTTISLPSCIQGNAYVAPNLASTGGLAPIAWTLKSGTLPTGVTFNSAGVWSGTCSGSVGNSSFIVTATDSSTPALTKDSILLVISVNAASSIISNSMCGVGGGGTDRTAALPATYLCSAEANTPRTGSVVSVGGGSLQTAYNGASCGADIQLTAGNTYTLTSLAAKGCSDAQWIWIRTVPSGNLPAEGVTTTPCYSNVTSLADYPAFPCPTSGAFTAKIQVAAGTTIANGGDHIRLENVEIAKGSGAAVQNLVNAASGSKQVYDRVWFHGNPGEETGNAIFMDGGSNISVVDSAYTDGHCISSIGTGCEGHGFNATTAPGPFKISHNFISAGGQYIFYGGGGFASGTPTSIEISYNHGYRPFTWDPACTIGSGCPGGVVYNGGVSGHAYTVKNCVEFKNAQNVLMFGNEWDNTWGGFSQVGNCITLTPKSQSAGVNNLCPLCVVQDITERYDFIHYSGQPWQIANLPNDNGAFATAGQRYSIHDVVADHTFYVGCSSCSNYMTELFTSPSAPTSMLMTGVFLNHLTIVQDNFTNTNLMAVGGPLAAPQQGTGTLENSILPSGNFGIGNVGGTTNQCAFSPAASQPKFTACWTTPVFTNNGIPYGSGTSCNGHGCGGTWGAGQILAADQNAVQYTNLVNGNYKLQVTSPFHNQGTDGLDLGADIVTLNSYLANVPVL